MSKEEVGELGEKPASLPPTRLLAEEYVSRKSALEIAQTQLLHKIFSERKALD